MTERPSRSGSLLSEFGSPQETSPLMRWGFAVVALVLLSSESVTVFLFPDTHGWTDVIVWSLIPAVLLVLSGFFPSTIGIAYLAVVFASNLLDTSTSTSMIGVYLLLAYWLSRGWYWQSLVAFLPVAASEALTSSTLPATLVGIGLGSAMSVAGGLILRRYRTRLLSEQVRSEQLEQVASRTSDEVRQELAKTLHDSVVRDLVRISYISNAVAAESSEKEQWKLVEQTAADALKKLRDLGAVEGAGTPKTDQSIEQVLQSCKNVLQSHQIQLTFEGPAVSRIPLDPAAKNTLSIAMREACTNILKYAPAGSAASLATSIDEDLASFIFTNQIDAARAPASPVSGKFGLATLASDAKLRGGDLNHWTVGNKWVLVLELPVLSQ